MNIHQLSNMHLNLDLTAKSFQSNKRLVYHLEKKKKKKKIKNDFY